MSVFEAARPSVVRYKTPIKSDAIDYYVETLPGQTPARAGWRTEGGIFNEGLPCAAFLTDRAHLAEAPPTGFAGLPIIGHLLLFLFLE